MKALSAWMRNAAGNGVADTMSAIFNPSACRRPRSSLESNRRLPFRSRHRVLRSGQPDGRCGGGVSEQWAQVYNSNKGTNMSSVAEKELYSSPNGDRWTLAQDGDGKLIVRHQPNRASGGIDSEIPVDIFLAHGGHGPEHQALSAVLAELSNNDADSDKSDAEISERVNRVLGQAVVRCWSELAPEIQATLFEAAVQAEGETMRQTLAMHLHDRHERTVQSVQAKAMPEPDSLGG